MDETHVQPIAAPSASWTGTPTWPFALRPNGSASLPLHGVVAVSGESGAGKSYLSIGSIEAARAGWNVHYITAAMPPRLIAQRALAYLGDSEPPAGWRIADARPGHSVEALDQDVRDLMHAGLLLVVLDSYQGLADLGDFEPAQLIRWARRLVTAARASVLLVHDGRLAGSPRAHRLLLNVRTARLSCIGAAPGDLH